MRVEGFLEPGPDAFTMIDPKEGLSDVRVLHASGEESETQIAHGVADQLIRAARPPGRLPPFMVPEGLPNLEPMAVGAAILGLLGTLQEEGPIIVVDDVQWADDPSLRALLFALRPLEADRVLALLAMREGPDRLPERDGSLLVVVAFDEGGVALTGGSDVRSCCCEQPGPNTVAPGDIFSRAATNTARPAAGRPVPSS
jgi:hypothetical protein